METSPFAESNQITPITPIALKEASSVQRVRVDVNQIQNVKSPLLVALKTVQMDEKAWTAVQVMKIVNDYLFRTMN